MPTQTTKCDTETMTEEKHRKWKKKKAVFPVCTQLHFNLKSFIFSSSKFVCIDVDALVEKFSLLFSNRSSSFFSNVSTPLRWIYPADFLPQTILYSHYENHLLTVKMKTVTFWHCYGRCSKTVQVKSSNPNRKAFKRNTWLCQGIFTMTNASVERIH